jgi:hypothetical protein
MKNHEFQIIIIFIIICSRSTLWANPTQKKEKNTSLRNLVKHLGNSVGQWAVNKFENRQKLCNAQSTVGSNLIQTFEIYIFLWSLV